MIVSSSPGRAVVKAGVVNDDGRFFRFSWSVTKNIQYSLVLSGLYCFMPRIPTCFEDTSYSPNGKYFVYDLRSVQEDEALLVGNVCRDGIRIKERCRKGGGD